MEKGNRDLISDNSSIGEDRAKNIHEGHRDRMRERFLKNGLMNFQAHEIIEMLLYYSVPRKNTTETAHELIDRFGSFSGVFDAPEQLLMDCNINKSTVVLLKMIPQLCARYYQDKYLLCENRLSTDNVEDYILRFFIGADVERVCLLLLDVQGKCIFCNIISEGSFSASELSIQRIMKLAVKHHAAGAIIAHNHPSGLPLPSQSDVSATVTLRDSLKMLGVTLLDHLIIADMDYLSMASVDEYSNIFFYSQNDENYSEYDK